ncbi:Doublesex- and mab-3-related transcription factor A2 [Araneus ventricosus]|uniref:Doublesex-and mab-3-related transcription factor A2 n=1 Tax=Araneus ventricosus TaxID=182803 RepID=A0A4Y2D024_ARAVE|nr:Doublesex- and mab-3-related transcription factor A2 [Araneus ventricosus]
MSYWRPWDGAEQRCARDGVKQRCARNRVKQRCAKCWLHGKAEIVKGHSKKCKYLLCRCEICILINCCRKGMAIKTDIYRLRETGVKYEGLLAEMPAKLFFKYIAAFSERLLPSTKRFPRCRHQSSAGAPLPPPLSGKPRARRKTKLMKSDIVLRRQHVCRAMEAHSENFWVSGKRYGEENYSPGLLSEEEIDVVGLSPEEESRKAGGRTPSEEIRPRLSDPRSVDPVSKLTPVERSAPFLDRNYQPAGPGLVPKDICYSAEPVKVHLKRFEPTIVSGPVLDRRMSEEKNYQPVPILNSARPMAEQVPHYRPVWPYPSAPAVGAPIAMPSEYSSDVLQHPNYAESRHYGKVSVIFNASSERVTSLSHTVTAGHPYVSASLPPNGYPYVQENYVRCNNHGKVPNYSSVTPAEEAGSRISPLSRPTVDSQQYPETPPQNKRIYYEEEPLRSRKISRYSDPPNFNKSPEGNSENLNPLPPSGVGNVKYPEGISVDLKERYNTQPVRHSDITRHDHDHPCRDTINAPPENISETMPPLSHPESDVTRNEYVTEQQAVRSSPPQLNYANEPQYENYEHYGKKATWKNNTTANASGDIPSAVSQQYQEDVQRVTEKSNRDPSQQGNYAKCSNHGNVSETISVSSEEVHIGSEIEVCSSSASDDRLSQKDHAGDRPNQDSQTKFGAFENTSQSSVPKTTSAASLSGQQNKSEEKKRVPTCARCRNHNETAILKGHKIHCPWRTCDCSKCVLVHQRQAVMAKQVALNRKQQDKNPDILSPSSLASSDVILETSQRYKWNQNTNVIAGDKHLTSIKGSFQKFHQKKNTSMIRNGSFEKVNYNETKEYSENKEKSEVTVMTGSVHPKSEIKPQ